MSLMGLEEKVETIVTREIDKVMCTGEGVSGGKVRQNTNQVALQ